MSDIDTAVADNSRMLDLKRPIREADIGTDVAEGLRRAHKTDSEAANRDISDFAIYCANPPDDFVRPELQRHSQRRVRS